MNRDVIVALDFKNSEETLGFLSLFKTVKPFVKIGMELFYAEGPDMVRKIRDMGHKVFLDLKLHDIPNTVERAMRNLRALGADMTNVHAAGGAQMMAAAREGLGEGAILIAVTQLTSTSEAVMREELLIERTLPEVVISYARNAQKSGLDGVVCSPLEAPAVKAACGAKFLAVTPGVRFPDGEIGDQSRVATPARASELGSDFIVMGRPITRAADPVGAYLRAASEFIGG